MRNREREGERESEGRGREINRAAVNRDIEMWRMKERKTSREAEAQEK